MHKRNQIVAWSALLILLLAGLAWAGADDDDPAPKPKECERVKECRIEWKDVPEAVQKTIKEQAGEHELTEIEKCTKGEQACYDAEWLEGENEVEVCVAPDGKLLHREVEPADEDEDEEEDDHDDDKD